MHLFLVVLYYHLFKVEQTTTFVNIGPLTDTQVLAVN